MNVEPRNKTAEELDRLETEQVRVVLSNAEPSVFEHLSRLMGSRGINSSFMNVNQAKYLVRTLSEGREDLACDELDLVLVLSGEHEQARLNAELYRIEHPGVVKRRCWTCPFSDNDVGFGRVLDVLSRGQLRQTNQQARDDASRASRFFCHNSIWKFTDVAVRCKSKPLLCAGHVAWLNRVEPDGRKDSGT